MMNCYVLHFQLLALLLILLKSSILDVLKDTEYGSDLH